MAPAPGLGLLLLLGLATALSVREQMEAEVAQALDSDDEDLLAALGGEPEPEQEPTSEEEHVDLRTQPGSLPPGVPDIPGLEERPDGLYYGGEKVTSITGMDGQDKGKSFYDKKPKTLASSEENGEGSLEPLDSLEIPRTRENDNLDEIRSMTELRSVMPIKSIEEIEKITPIESIQEIKNIQEVKEIHPIPENIAKMFIKKHRLVSSIGGPDREITVSGPGEIEDVATLEKLYAQCKQAVENMNALIKSETHHMKSIAGGIAGIAGEIVEDHQHALPNLVKALKEEIKVHHIFGRFIKQKLEGKNPTLDISKKFEEPEEQGKNPTLDISSLGPIKSVTPIKSIQEVESMQEVKSLYELTAAQAKVLKAMQARARRRRRKY